MNKNSNKLFIYILISVLIIPQIVLAAWWNPFTWKIFQKKETTIQVQAEIKNSEEKITELEKQLNDLKNHQSNNVPVVTEEVKSKPVIIDNSAVIRAEVEAKLKAQADLDALIIKQKADEQARLDALKIETERQAAQNSENIARQRAVEQQAIFDTAQAKQEKLNTVNKNIADLNAQYLKDIENCTKRLSGRGATYADLAGCENPIEIKYQRDYNALKIEFQQIQYGN